MVFAWHSPHTHLIVGPNDFLVTKKKVGKRCVLSDEKTEIMTEKNDRIGKKKKTLVFEWHLPHTPLTIGPNHFMTA